jgi:hypothetical protein
MQSVPQCIDRIGYGVVSKCTPNRCHFDSVAQQFDMSDGVVGQRGSTGNVSKRYSLVTYWIYLVSPVD